MLTKIQKWGNSQGLRLNKTLMSEVAMAVGDAVDVSVQNGALVITPVRQVRGGHNLRQLVREIPRGYRASELDWGAPAGHEAW